MSDHKFSLELSEEAYDDLVEIQNYSYQEFGESQWQKYGQALDKGLQHILNHPHTGHIRPDVPEGYLSWPVNEHIMIYRVQSSIIYVVRILHKRMNFRFQF